jgi:DNA polymerase-4/protein ImuB
VVLALEQRSPLVEQADLGCAYVGLDSLDEMYGGEARLITSLLQAAPHQFNPRVGVAAGNFPAYVAAVTSGGGQATKVPQDIGKFLNGFSIDLLPLSWEDQQRLHGFGLHTLDQVDTLSVGSVQAQLGVPGRTAWQLARGTDPSPLVTHQREPVVSESLTFPAPTVTGQALLTGVETLLGRAFARPEVRGRYVRAAALEGRIWRRPPWSKQVVFKDAAGSPDRAFRVIKHALDSVTLPGPLEDLTLTLAGFTGEAGTQASLFTEVRRWEQLREMVRRLEVQLGGKPPIFQVREIEPWSRIPERRRALVPFDP